MQREYDIVLFGATGFTGELTAAYLAAHLPPGARLALAGRSLEKLTAVRARLADATPAAAQLPLISADASDPESLARLAASTRVAVSTVGPYLRHGEPLVAACAAAGTDYLDLTGEPEFVDTMYLRHHAAARESGARLVHSCGFDSIPYDLGVLHAIGEVPEAARVPLRISGYGLMSGSISGGTYHSLVEALGRLKESGRVSRQRRAVERHAPDGAIAPGRRVRGGAGRLHREPLAGGWVMPAPTIDPQHVLRSARLNPAYGPDFSYSHYVVTGSLRSTATLLVGLGLLTTLAQLEPTRRRLLALRRQGSGPSAQRRERSFFRVRFVTEVGGDSPRRLLSEVSGGDPGYGETSKMLAEAALCMAFDELTVGGGQWTPALAMGTALIGRLTRAGISFRVLEDQAP